MKQNIDSVVQYERRDTLIISSPLKPEETSQENVANIIISVIKENLNINLSEADIYIAHRIGPTKKQRK